MSLDVPVLRESFALVVERAPHVTRRFYDVFFARYPEVRPMFGGQASRRQEEMLTKALAAVIEHLDDPAWLAETLRALGGKHVAYGVRDEQYAWVGESLLATLEEVLGDAWSPRCADAWATAYGAIAGLCLEGARAERARQASSSAAVASSPTAMP